MQPVAYQPDSTKQVIGPQGLFKKRRRIQIYGEASRKKQI
jgi:hypothetical protein